MRTHHPRHLFFLAFIIFISSMGACGADEENTTPVAVEVVGDYSVTSKIEGDNCSSGTRYSSIGKPILVTLTKVEWTACSMESGNDCYEIFYTMSSELFGHKSLSPSGNIEPVLQMGAYFNHIDECVSYEPSEPCPPKREEESGRLSLKRDHIFSGDWAGTYQQTKGNCTTNGKVWFRKTD